LVRVHAEAARGAADKLGLEFTYVGAANADDAELRRAFGMALAARPEIIQFGISGVLSGASAVFAKLVLDAHIPAVSPYTDFAQAGGLLSQGSNRPDNYRQGAGYVALILQGAQPGDLPVLLPTRFDIVVNLKTAKAIGVAMPSSVLLQATDVIE